MDASRREKLKDGIRNGASIIGALGLAIFGVVGVAELATKKHADPMATAGIAEHLLPLAPTFAAVEVSQKPGERFPVSKNENEIKDALRRTLANLELRLTLLQNAYEKVFGLLEKVGSDTTTGEMLGILKLRLLDAQAQVGAAFIALGKNSAQSSLSEIKSMVVACSRKVGDAERLARDIEKQDSVKELFESFRKARKA